jgi:ubiquinone/menaquinone biosynthesis C-methylase UbiE
VAIEKSNNPAAFLDFERAGWAANIAGYDDAFGPVSRQTVGPTLDAANLRPGMHLLDVCCGPGMLAQAAIERGARAVGLDFPEVIELARRLVAGGQFQAGDAQALPFADDTFDAVVCGYGVMHLPDAERAMREMLRVVRPGGRVAISVWDSRATNQFSLAYAAVRAHGNINVPLPHGADFFQFSTPEKMRAGLGEIGFTEVTATAFDQKWHVKSAQQVLDAIRDGTVRARALMAAQTDAAMVGIRQFFEQALGAMGSPDKGYDVPLPAIIGSGAKP